MAKILSSEEKESFIKTVEDSGYKWDLDLRLYPLYSGRGMFGEQCFGIVVEDPVLVHFLLGCMAKENKDLSIDLMNAQKIDTLGLDFIVYFPGYLWTERIEYANGNEL